MYVNIKESVRVSRFDTWISQLPLVTNVIYWNPVKIFPGFVSFLLRKNTLLKTEEKLIYFSLEYYILNFRLKKNSHRKLFIGN